MIGFPVCPKCGGTAWLPDLNYMTDQPIPGQHHRCTNPSCVEGVVISDELAEVAAKSWGDWHEWPEHPDSQDLDAARAALVAVLEKLKENQ